MDGRFDQHFIELFVTSGTPDLAEREQRAIWPFAVAGFAGIILFAGMASLV